MPTTLSSAGEISLLLLLLTWLPPLLVGGQQPGNRLFGATQPDGGGATVKPRARGPAIVTISVKHGRATHQGQLQTNSTPLMLWCHAVDASQIEGLRSRGGGDPPVLPAQEIYFTHNGQRHMANRSQDSSNGTLVIEQASISDAGHWTCHIRTKEHGNVNGEITVYLRPVVFSNSSLRIDDLPGQKFQFEASGVTILRGSDAQLECPVYGYPKPDIVWRKGALDVPLDDRIRVENGTLLIHNATYEDEGLYTCKASNMRRSSSEKRLQQSTVAIERRLRVKNELGWVLPLCIIVLTLALLIVIIVLCELRKRRKERKQLLADSQNGNGEEE